MANQAIGGAAAVLQAPSIQRKVVRGPDGTPQVVTIDTQTGQAVNDPQSYGVLDGQYYDPSSNPQPSTPAPPPGQGGMFGLNGMPLPETSTARKIINDVGRGGEQSRPSSAAPRSAENNYGYVSKPGIVGLAARMPGIPGMMGKVASLGINMNNTAAVNAARKDMGLEPTGIMGSIKGALSNNKGQVGNFTFGTEVAQSVGLANYNPQGMINMTPQQAIEFSKELGQNITPATPEQTAASTFGKSKGMKGLSAVFGNMSNNVTSFIDGLFGRQKSLPSYYEFDAKKAAASVRQNTGSNFNPTPSGFADMIGATAKGQSSGGQGGFPDAPSQSSGSRNSGGWDSAADRSRGEGMSPGAAGAIGRGEGGLY